MLVFAHSGYFHDLLDSFALGVIIINARGRIYAANTAAAAMLDRSREDLLSGPDIADEIISGTDDPESVRRYLLTALRRKMPQPPLRLRYASPSGPPRHLSLTVSHLTENEKVFGIMLQITDVTEIIALHERERAILDEKFRAERERVESLRTLSAAVAHQLRNPAMAIGGLTGVLLKKSPPADPSRPFLEAVLEQSRRLEAIVAAVGEITAPLCPHPSFFSLRDLAQSRLAHIQDASDGEAHPGRVWRLRGEDVRLCQDAGLLGQALDEILRNAALATPENGTVEVVIETADDRTSIGVLDQGPGISPDIAPYLFDPFFTTKAVGVGMGLCRTKRIMAALGGDVRVENHPDAGAWAVLTLPLSPRETNEPGQGQDAPPQTANDCPRPSPPGRSPD